MLVEITDAIDAGERVLGSSTYANHNESYWGDTLSLQGAEGHANPGDIQAGDGSLD